MQHPAMFTAAEKTLSAVEAMHQAWRQWARGEGAPSAEIALGRLDSKVETIHRANLGGVRISASVLEEHEEAQNSAVVICTGRH